MVYKMSSMTARTIQTNCHLKTKETNQTKQTKKRKTDLARSLPSLMTPPSYVLTLCLKRVSSQKCVVGMLQERGVFLHFCEVLQVTLDFRADFLLRCLLYPFHLFILSTRQHIVSPKGAS